MFKLGEEGFQSVFSRGKLPPDVGDFCILDGTQDGIVYLEKGFHPETIAKLHQMGHKMKPNVTGHEREVFGRAQIIMRDRATGILCAGSDGRADGCALGY